MASRIRQGTALAPACHTPVDDFRVACQAGVGTEAEPFGDAGAVAFKDSVGLFHQCEQGFQALGAAQVQGDTFLAS